MARMDSSPDLARQVDAAQSLLATPAARLAHRLEHALARCSQLIAEAIARADPASGASTLAAAGGLAIYAGLGSPLTQGLAMGLDGPVSAAELDAVERHLCPQGRGSRQLEICPFVDPSLPALLAERGYRVHEWQLTWSGPVPPERPQSTELRIAPVQPEERELFARAVMAGFLETEDVPESALALLRPMGSAAQHEQWMAWLGHEPVGGGTLSWEGGVAFLGGSGVRPAWRRRGAQGALIRARLQRARELGCELVYANTLPGTASRRNMERYGLSVAYPKILMLRPAN
jgi:GNAT superfamily N-acetyltransferase